MKRMIFWGSILILAVVLLSGCSSGPPIKNPQVTKSNLPERVFIENVPTYKQPPADCGPTSIRMVLSYYGQNFTEEEIGKARKGKGTKVSDLEAYSRSVGFEVYSFFDSKKDQMKYLIAQGYPLIAIGVRPPDWTKNEKYTGEGHYVVLVGYNDLEKFFYIHDPNGGRKFHIPYDVFKSFHTAHPTHGNYVICIYPKQK
jgi:ABC-type bacteriocin/lantibiotic exporter with double-glycine peptidase domain